MRRGVGASGPSARFAARCHVRRADLPIQAAGSAFSSFGVRRRGAPPQRAFATRDERRTDRRGPRAARGRARAAEQRSGLAHRGRRSRRGRHGATAPVVELHPPFRGSARAAPSGAAGTCGSAASLSHVLRRARARPAGVGGSSSGRAAGGVLAASGTYRGAARCSAPRRLRFAAPARQPRAGGSRSQSARAAQLARPLGAGPARFRPERVGDPRNPRCP
ncbi:MAG: hypothetical protein K0R38_2612 [Polyangiaceae bacterium]|nr:hypothetical protein [Polyangiaceae bacterium]